jgi:ABC-type glutathione transport system ATPase component
VLLKDPAVVILDEATSHLDAENEHLVQQALATALAGRTSLVIATACRPSRTPTRSSVLDEGRIVERGTHRSLVARAASTPTSTARWSATPPSPDRPPTWRAERRRRRLVRAGPGSVASRRRRRRVDLPTDGQHLVEQPPARLVEQGQVVGDERHAARRRHRLRPQLHLGRAELGRRGPQHEAVGVVEPQPAVHPDRVRVLRQAFTVAGSFSA